MSFYFDCFSMLYRFFVVTIFAFIGSFALGDTIKQQQIDMWVLAQSNMQSISLQSCDGQSFQSTFSWIIRPHQTKDYCLAFVNSSLKDIKLEYGFTDYGFTKEGYIACAQDINTGNLFSHILGYGTSVVVIPAQWFITQNISFQAPFSGQLQWCISYRSLNDAMAAGMFNIVLRKTDMVSLSVTGEYYGMIDYGKDFLVWLKDNRIFWFFVLIVLWSLFVFILIGKPHPHIKHKK